MIRVSRLTEKAFMQQIIQLAKLRGYMVFHTHDSRHSASGFPDLILVKGRVLIAAEIKVGKNKPTLAQEIWLRALSDAGVNVFVWTPESWDAIETTLE